MLPQWGVLVPRVPPCHTLRGIVSSFPSRTLHKNRTRKPVSTDEERESCQGTRLRQQFHFDIMNISSCGPRRRRRRRGRLNWHDFVLPITHVNSLAFRIPLYTTDSNELHTSSRVYLKDRY